jgi:hypothetical protein
VETEPSYGTTRERSASVSYSEIERAALDHLAQGQRPSVKTIRETLKRGSDTTIASALKRFWRDLGVRAQGDPAALTRLPSEISEAVENIWQRALTLAAESAKSDGNAARERLDRMRIENDVREQSLALREKEYETQARERERALTDSRDHLLSTLRMLEADRESLRARERRIKDLETQIEGYREQLALLVARQNRKASMKTKSKRKLSRRYASRLAP